MQAQNLGPLDRIARAPSKWWKTYFIHRKQNERRAWGSRVTSQSSGQLQHIHAPLQSEIFWSQKMLLVTALELVPVLVFLVVVPVLMDYASSTENSVPATTVSTTSSIGKTKIVLNTTTLQQFNRKLSSDQSIEVYDKKIVCKQTAFGSVWRFPLQRNALSTGSASYKHKARFIAITSRLQQQTLDGCC